MASPSKSKVCFFFDNVTVTLKNRTALKRFIETIFKNEGRKLHALNYIFCSDPRLLEINRQYLNHDYYTDIISFDLSESSTGVTGEIYISIDRVRDNSQNEDTSFKSELHRVIFHGALHLCGYKDKTKKDLAEMRLAENKLLTRYGIDVS